MKGIKRFRRQLAATAAALGVAGVVVGTAAAADQVTNINVPSDFSQPLGITAGPDGNMWFADPGAQSIGKLAGGFPQLIPSPGAGGPAGITSGPDGNLWYSEFGSDPTPGVPGDETATVGRVSTGGAFQEFTLSANALNLQGIATGPDGNLWVAAKGTDTLWKVTTAGASTPYGAGAVLNAQGVARGPAGDGNIYVTTSTGVSSKVATSGAAPGQIAPLANAFGIALGPDNSFYVTHPGGVMRMATNGAGLPGGVTLPGSDSRGIAVGPDGAMWFAQYAKGSVGVLGAGGAYREIALPGCIGPEGVASGGGAVYVTCFGAVAGPGGIPPAVRGRTIVRITQDGGVTPVTPVTPGGPGGGGAAGGKITGSFSLKKKTVTAGAKFTVSVKFTQALNKSRVSVQYKHNKRGKGKINSYKTLGSKVVTGLKAGVSVKIGKPGVYLLRVGFANAGKQTFVKAVKITVKAKP